MNLGRVLCYEFCDVVDKLNYDADEPDVYKQHIK